MQSRCSGPIASASTAAPHLHLLQLLLPVCVCFSCCSLIASASAAARCLRPLQLLLPIASASTAPQLRLLQLLQYLIASASTAAHPIVSAFNCCSPDCVRFNCCSPIACIRLLDFQPMPGPNVLEHSLRSSRFSTKVARH